MIKKLIPATVEKLLQEAIKAELEASHLYKHIANHLQRLGYLGAAKYFRSEYAQETEHYQKLADYLNDVGYVAELPELDSVDEDIDSLSSAIETAYDSEVELMQKYVKWYQAADPVTQQLLLGFLEHQRLSVGELGDLLSRIGLAGDDECALLLIDKELEE